MTDSTDRVVVTRENSDELKQQIVCPYSLKVLMESLKQGEGTLGAIQNFRCSPSGGVWETRPLKKTNSGTGDKWYSDLMKLASTPRDQKITLSDGNTQMNGFQDPNDKSDKRLRFTHEDGVQAKQVAIKVITEGTVRASKKTWDKQFAAQANMTYEDLVNTYPELYKTPRSRKKNGDEETATADVSPLGLGFFESEYEGSDGEGESRVASEALSIEDEELIREEEEEFDPEPAYSVTAEAELTESRTHTAPESRTFDYPQQVSRTGSAMQQIHAPTGHIRVIMKNGESVDLFRVTDPRTGKEVFLQEGENDDYSGFFITVTE